MAKGFFSNVFSSSDKPAVTQAAAPAGEIDKNFQPAKGVFLRTLEFPEMDLEGKEVGKSWLEGGYDGKKGNWVLWRKTLRMMDDPLAGGKTNILNSKVMFPETDFVNVYDQMTTYEQAQQALGLNPLPNKTPAKLGGDYYRQFAWREGLMMSRSGRLYPVTDANLAAENFFNQADIDGSREFLARLKTEQFIPVPLTLPTGDWEKLYNANRKTTDERLNVLYFRNGGNKDGFDLALQIVGQEAPEVLYAHIQRGFNPKIFESNPAQHFALIKAALDRASVDALALLTDAGASFYVCQDHETPIELALQKKAYSHLHLMLSRDGAELANYCDDESSTPAANAIALQDRQAFRALYLEGLDYAQADKNGLYLIHHGFEHSFLPAIYAWLDEGLPIDKTIDHTAYTGLSIARRNNDQPMIDFAIAKGADKNAPDFPAPAPDASVPAPVAVTPEPAAPASVGNSLPVFSADLLNSTATNREIEAAASAYVAAGGSLNVLSAKGQSVFELCWKNRKSDPDLDRRTLVPLLAKLGADPAALLSDGTTVLTRATSGVALDMDFLKAIAPYTRDVNNADANGNDLLHTLQMNSSETVGMSGNVASILKLFPALDLNRQNNDGYSNIGLAVRLNRGQTLKLFTTAPDLKQTTASGWSLLDLAFTSATGMEKVAGVARADKITATSDSTRTAFLDLLGRSARADAPGLTAAFNRTRPDGRTLAAVLKEEAAPAPVIMRLKALGLQA